MANAGQICCITKRFIVQNSIKDAYLEGLKQAVGGITVGDSSDPANMMGCMVSERAAAEVEAQVQDMVAQGAKLVAGGTREGAFMQPTIIECGKDLPCAKDLEIFGPVWTVIGFDADEEAIEIANQSIYGLNGGVIAGSVEHGLRIAQHIQSGTVVVNGEGCWRTPNHAFGGYKHSGLGREGIPDLIKEFSQRKTLVIRGIN